MPHFSKEILENRAFLSRALAFNTQLPIGGSAGTRIGDKGSAIPNGVSVNEDGSAVVRFHAPNAGSVSVRFGEERIAMNKGEDGIWYADIPYQTPGMKPVFFSIDGTEVLNPLAPIGFGWSQPINYIEFPEEDCDFYLIKDVPHGTIAQETYFSSVTGQYESCMLYLPPDYMGSSGRFYPVLYLQHGHGENEKCWIYQGKVNYIMDNLIAEGKAEPCILVMNNGMVHSAAEDGSPCMNSSLLEHLLLRDCIPFIEGKYRVKSGKENRAMAGLSMGSMQTSITTMKNPEYFEYVGIFSGFLRSLMEGERNNLHLKAMDEADFRSRYKVFMRCMGNEDGFRQIFDEDCAYMENRGLDPEHWKAHIIKRYPGEHEWQVWRKCIRDFAMVIFK